MKRPFRYEHIQVGEELGRKEIVVTDQMIKECAKAIESTNSWYVGNSPYGRAIAPPTIFDNDTLRILDEQYQRFGSVHAKQAWEFKKPVKVGTKVTLTVHLVDKFIKRDRGWIVMELIATDEEGMELCSSRHTSIMSLKEGVNKDESA